MTDPLTEVRFWAQVIGDAKRTIMCNPDAESRIKGWIDARGMAGLLTVKPSPYVPENRIFILDEQGMQANLNERLARPIKFWP